MPAKTTTTKATSPAPSAQSLSWGEGARIASRYLAQFEPGGKLAGNLAEAKAVLVRDFGVAPEVLRGITSARLPAFVVKKLLTATPSRIEALARTALPYGKNATPTKTAGAKRSAPKSQARKPVARSPRKKKSETDGMIDATVKIVEMIRKAANL